MSLVPNEPQDFQIQQYRDQLNYFNSDVATKELMQTLKMHISDVNSSDAIMYALKNALEAAFQKGVEDTARYANSHEWASLDDLTNALAMKAFSYYEHRRY